MGLFNDLLGPPLLGNGLTVWLKMDEGSGTIAHDTSEHGNNGTLVNSPTWVTGKKGLCLNFNGSNSIVTLPSSLAASLFNGTAFTVCAWVYPTTSKQDEGILNSNVSNTADKNLHIAIRNGTALLGFYNDDLSGGTVSLNTWTFLTFTYAGGTGNRLIYVNGTQAASGAPSGTLNTSGGSVSVGVSYTSSAVMQGMIDDLRIYNRVLSSQEITKLYNSY
jgi:hypothetical protein